MEAEAPPPRPVRAAAVSLMSRRLLEGYSMLAESCPDCGVPLLRKPGGPTLCVNCCRDDEEEGAATTADAPAAAAATAPGLQPALLPANGPPAALANGHSGQASSEDEEGVLEAPPPLRGQLLRGSGAGAAPAIPPAGGSPAADDTISQRIADKMLEGWALLDASCPRCQAPLVRNRQQRMYCVGCELYVVREEDLQQQQQQQEAQQQQQQQQRQPGPVEATAGPAAAPASSSPGRRASGVAVEAAGSAAGGIARGVPSPSARPASKWREAGTATVTGEPVCAQPAGGQALLQQLDTTMASVAARMDQASRELAGASTQQAQAGVELIQSCASALAALEDCRRKLAAGRG